MDEKSIALSVVLVTLFRGAINRETNEKQWTALLAQQTHIDDYVSKLGLVLIVDMTDGYAYLKQQTQTEDHLDIPRLIPRYQLSYPVSVMLVLLRKQLLEFDSGSNSERLILSKQEFVESLRPYLKDTSNEVKQLKEIDTNLAKIKDMGFIRMLNGVEDHFEVQRILRSFVDAQLLGELDLRLQEYRNIASNGTAQEDTESESE
jgi:hypothetical protein